MACSRIYAAGDLHAGRTARKLKNMWKDEIVEEIRKVRDEYAAKFNYDLDAIYEDIKKQEEQTERKVISLPPKRVELPETEKA